MLKIDLCDYEQEYIDKLSYIIDKVTYGDVYITKHLNPFSLVTHIVDEEKGAVDAVYINVTMNNQSGIKIAKNILEEFPHIKIIFTSANMKDAIDIFSVDPIYFLIKPYIFDYVKDSVYKLMNIVQEEQTDLIFIKDPENKGKLLSIKTRDIYYIESELRLIHIYTHDCRYTTYMTMEDIQSKLKNNFVRCHRSFIINRDKIKNVVKEGVILYNDCFVPVSRNKYKEVVQMMNHYLKSD